MAELVSTMAMAHAPGVTGWLESAPEAEQKPILEGYHELGRRMSAARPDVIIGIANDHMLNLPLKAPPDFRIGTAAHWSGPAEFFKSWLKLPDYSLTGHPECAALIAEAFRSADVSFDSSDELLFDDNWSVPLHFLTPNFDVPFVPIHMNCINPPVPDAKTSYHAGEAIARAIDAMPQGMRVAVIGTGGLSHEPGGKRYFQVDEEFDRWFLALLARGDVDEILREATIEKMEAAGGGGTAELFAWVAVSAVAKQKAADVVFYVPSIEMRCGIGGVEWPLGAAA